LVLAGGSEATSGLFRLLPKSMRLKVVASVRLAANAPKARIIEEVLAIGSKAERAHELEQAEALIAASAKGQNGVIGMFATLEALNENRVRELVYAEGYAMRGGICDQCR